MNRFINEADGSQTAFLDGNQPERLCEPLKEYIEGKGGRVITGIPVDEVITDDTGLIKHLIMRDGSKVTADHYVSAMPVDVFKRILPHAWSRNTFFKGLKNLKGVPVINLQIWFDGKIKSSKRGLCFSRSECLSVYADMSLNVEEYYNEKESMLSLVFAPADKSMGGERDWIKENDEEIVEETLKELRRLFPGELYEEETPGGVKVKKYAVVRTPRSVYAALPGMNAHRPTQATPIPNFTLAGDWTSQKYLGSMEGAVYAGKLAAEVVVEGRVGEGKWEREGMKPGGNRGETPIAFGGGQVGIGDDFIGHD